MFDTHAHVHSSAYDTDREAMLARAAEAGVSRILTVGTDLTDSQHAHDAAVKYALDWSLGIHPHEAKEAPEDVVAAFDAMRAKAAKPALAIGECGLDYYYDHSPRDRQRAVLIDQIRYARAAHLPVIFHQRDAFDDFVEVLGNEWADGMRGVVHCFTGDADQARRCVEFGLMLGIGGVVTFKTADPVRAAVRAVGIEQIIMETDCPYLAPVPHRGQRNEPAFVTASIAAVAALLDLPTGEVAKRTASNASALFEA
jgi:TatD DNase family protein